MRRAYGLVAISGLVVGLSASASAETLREALAATYTHNPELAAERARLRAIDEGVPQALSGARPKITGSAELSQRYTSTTPPGTSNTFSPRGFSISVTQPVFRGFRVLNSTKQAEALVLAGREALLNTEQDVLFDAVVAYVDVLRDRSIITLQRNNLKVLREQLRATQDRFSVGEVTRTDVAQAEARVSRAVSALNLAEANFNSSRANYAVIVGRLPGELSQPPSIARLLPRSRDRALAIADTGHPAIQTAKYNDLAAVHGVDVTTGELLPTVTIDAGYSKDYDPSPATRRSESAAITGRLNVPLYQGGEVYSRVRESIQVRAQRRLEHDLVQRQVRAAVISAWGQLDAAEAQTRSDQAQVSANEVALAGVREEAKVGQRTVLDVLDAEQELLDAKVALVTSRRNLVVASYALLAAIGDLSAERLNLAVVIYDPMDYYHRVRNKWFGIDTGYDR